MAEAKQRPRKPKQPARRQPKRQGAQQTVEIIFEAAARILAAEGRSAFNTNRLAEVAGLSVGAIYGYFPNKEAILLAMARRELDLMRDRVVAALIRPAGDAPKDPVRRAVRALIKGYGARGRARRVLMETLFSLGGTEELSRPISEIADLVAANGQDLLPPDAQPPSPIRLFVLTRALDSVVRAATYEGVSFFNEQAFEDELVHLANAVLRGP